MSKALLAQSPRPTLDAAHGKALVESGKYAIPRGNRLGRIRHWGLDVYEGSPKAWKDAWLAEVESRR